MKLIVAGLVLSALFVAATVYVIREARKTERAIAAGFRWDMAAREAGYVG